MVNLKHAIFTDKTAAVSSNLCFKTFLGLLLTFPVADYNEFSLFHLPFWYICTDHSHAPMHQKNDAYWNASSYIQFINMLQLGFKFVPLFHIIIYFINLHKFWLQKLCRIILPFSTNCVAKTIWTEMELTSDNIALLVKGLLSNFILKEKVLSAIF